MVGTPKMAQIQRGGTQGPRAAIGQRDSKTKIPPEKIPLTFPALVVSQYFVLTGFLFRLLPVEGLNTFGGFLFCLAAQKQQKTLHVDRRAFELFDLSNDLAG